MSMRAMMIMTTSILWVLVTRKSLAVSTTEQIGLPLLIKARVAVGSLRISSIARSAIVAMDKRLREQRMMRASCTRLHSQRNQKAEMIH